jgi:ferredoxin
LCPATRRQEQEFFGSFLQKRTALRSELSVLLDGVETIVPVPVGVTLLDAAEAAGLDLPSICRSGNCAACAVMLVAGRVRMEACKGLSRRDQEAGLILACQAVPETEFVSISYD